MEIVNPCYSLLTNYEVLTTLLTIKDEQNKAALPNLATVTYETIKYLESTPCKNQSRENILAFMKEIERFPVTADECISMINFPPITALDVQLLVPNSEDRLTDEQVASILILCRTYFPTMQAD